MTVEIALLKQIPYLDTLSNDALNSISHLFTCKPVKKGGIFHVQEELDNILHILVKGKIKTYRLSLSGKEQIWNIRVPVISLNDLGFFQGQPNFLSMQAMEPSVLYTINQQDFDTILQRYPQVALNTIKILAERGCDFLWRSARLDHTIHERLGKMLLAYSTNNEKNILLTQHDIACILGVSRASVNKSLRLIQDSGAICLKRGVITIEDDKMLKKLFSFG